MNDYFFILFKTLLVTSLISLLVTYFLVILEIYTSKGHLRRIKGTLFYLCFSILAVTGTALLLQIGHYPIETDINDKAITLLFASITAYITIFCILIVLGTVKSSWEKNDTSFDGNAQPSEKGKENNPIEIESGDLMKKPL